MSRMHLRIKDPQLANNPAVKAWLRDLETILQAELDLAQAELLVMGSTVTGPIDAILDHRASMPDVLHASDPTDPWHAIARGFD